LLRQKILISFSVFIIILILVLNLNTFYWADDYAILNEINSLGIFERCRNGYFNWDGRYLTPASFIQGFLLKYLPIQLITLFWNLLFLTSGYIIALIIENNSKIVPNTKFPNLLLFRLFITLFFWFASSSHISQTVYWATGGVYSFNLLIGVIWLYYFNIYEQKKANKILLLFLTLLLSISTQNLILPYIFFIIIKIISNYRSKKQFHFVLISILVIGFIFLNFAPGNSIRVNEINENLIVDFNIITLFKFILKTIYLYTKFSVFLILVIFFFNYLFRIKKINLFLTFAKKKWITFLNSEIFFFMGISSVIPFVLFPSLASERTSIYFIYFFFLYFSIKAFPKIINRFSKILENNFKLIIVSYCLLTLFYCYNFIMGIELKNQMNSREKELISSENKTIKIKLINPNFIPILYNYRDYKNNSDWALEETKKYYKINDIDIVQ
jgi:hypothetical protein